MPLQTPASRRFAPPSSASQRASTQANQASARFLRPSQIQQLSQSSPFATRTPFVSTQRTQLPEDVDVIDGDDDGDDDNDHDNDDDRGSPDGNDNTHDRNEPSSDLPDDRTGADTESIGHRAPYMTQATSTTKRRKISLHESTPAINQNSDFVGSSSPSPIYDDNLSEVVDAEAHNTALNPTDSTQLTLPLSPSRLTHFSSPSQLAAAPTTTAAATTTTTTTTKIYPSFQSRLLNPTSTLRRPPTHHDASPDNILPDVFSPSRRKPASQREYLPAGNAELVRSWILNVVARAGEPTPLAPPARVKDVICQDAMGRFAVAELEGCDGPASQVVGGVDGDGDGEPVLHMLINTEAHQTGRNASALARRKMEKIVAGSDVQVSTNRALTWTVEMGPRSTLVGGGNGNENENENKDNHEHGNAGTAQPLREREQTHNKVKVHVNWKVS